MTSYQQRYKRSAAILNEKYCIYMIPALLSAVGVSLSEFADSLIVGRLLNEDAFAIVNLGTPIVFMASMVYTVTGLGGSLLYAEYLAKKEKERADAYFTASTLLSLAAGLVLFAGLMLLRSRLAGPFGCPDELRAGFNRYTSYLCWFVLAGVVLTNVTYFLPVVGKPFLSMGLTVAANVMNVGLDIFFIRVFGMGCEGAALATVVSYLIALFAAVVICRFQKVPLRLQKLESPWRSIAEIVRKGFPVGIVQAGYAVTGMFCNHFMNLSFGEEGVVIGTRLADDLGMPGTPYSNIANMTQKSAMHRSLKKAGLRYIRGAEVKSWDDCLAFLEETGTEDVVLKHDHGAASVGVHLVHGKDELKAAFEQERGADNNMFGEADTRFLLQERIFGTEYIVNTISRDGIPALTSVFKYFKKRTPSGAIIYSGNESINEPTEQEQALIDYALKAVCALGITDGPVHGEYMVDKNGPVLIEANCRVMGSSAPSGFLDKVFGYHETEVILNSMLDKEYHRRFRERPYKPLRKGYAKDFSAACDQPISFSGIVPILLGMKSFYSGWVENAGRTDMLHETVDLETETGCIYLVHDDPEVVKREFEQLMYIEENYPKLLQSDEPLFVAPENKTQITPEIEEILNEDPEVLISRIVAWYKDGAHGESIVPEVLLDAAPYNRRIMELIRDLC